MSSCKATNAKTWDGRDVPTWEKCGSQVQGKWMAAAAEAARALGWAELGWPEPEGQGGA